MARAAKEIKKKPPTMIMGPKIIPQSKRFGQTRLEKIEWKGNNAKIYGDSTKDKEDNMT